MKYFVNLNFFFFIDRSDWETFEPYTNVLWLHYLADKMSKKKTLINREKKFETKLKGFMRHAKKCSSAAEIVHEFFG